MEGDKWKAYGEHTYAISRIVLFIYLFACVIAWIDITEVLQVAFEKLDHVRFSSEDRIIGLYSRDTTGTHL